MCAAGPPSEEDGEEAEKGKGTEVTCAPVELTLDFASKGFG